MPRCLVTGASGFLGAHLVRLLLDRGDEVRCLIRGRSRLGILPEFLGQQFIPPESNSSATPIPELVDGDVTDPASLARAVAGVDTVYHLAGLIRGRSLTELLNVNERGVANLVQACAEQPQPPVLVHVSSLAAMGPARQRALEPGDPLQPVSNYGRSKSAGEQTLLGWADRVPISIVRPPIVLGEGDRFSVELFRMIRRCYMFLVPGLKDHHFSVIHARDLGRILMLAAERGARIPPRDDLSGRQGRYLAARGEDPTYAELGRWIATALRHKSFTVRAPLPFVWAYACAAELGCRLLQRAPEVGIDKVREAAAGDWISSPRSVAEALGFMPEHPFSEQLRGTADWYSEHGWL